MNQTRISSLIEAVFNTALGFVISLGASLVVYPLFGWAPGISTTLGITAVFTVISVARGYLVRRFFNARLHRAAQAIAESVSAHPPPPMHADREPCPACIDAVRSLQRTREVVATCPQCGMQWLHGRYAAKPTTNPTRMQ